jgi:Uma2 family endonuclease
MVTSPNPTQIVYPDSDGKPMADNTRQFRWITTIKSNLDWLFANNADVFVAGDLLWYPVEGDNKTRQAPDVMVAFGRPKGERGSYQQWQEENIPPQVVFEISSGNTQTEMTRKLLFYDRYGVEEYYIYNPDKNVLGGCIRRENRLESRENLDNWVSPRLGIRFQLARTGVTLVLSRWSTFHQLQRRTAIGRNGTAMAEQNDNWPNRTTIGRSGKSTG